MLRKPKVVLFCPLYDGPPLGAPACLLSLAAPRQDAGFEAVIVGAAIEPDWLSLVLSELQDALCLGISVLTGLMIRRAQLRKATKDQPKLRWRLKSNRYSFPWELWVGRKLEKLVTWRSLVTGQPLRRQGADVC